MFVTTYNADVEADYQRRVCSKIKILYNPIICFTRKWDHQGYSGPHLPYGKMAQCQGTRAWLEDPFFCSSPTLGKKAQQKFQEYQGPRAM